MADGHFSVVVHGTVEGAECTAAGMMYCRSTLVKGPDWALSAHSGEHANTVDVVTQMSERLPGPDPKFTWNTPFEFALTSTSVHGWPQVAFSLLTTGGAGAEQVVAYARCHVPLFSGKKRIELPLMQPMQSSPANQTWASISGHVTELRDVAFLCSNDDRTVVTMKPVPGYITVCFDVTVSGRQALGYSVGAKKG